MTARTVRRRASARMTLFHTCARSSRSTPTTAVSRFFTSPDADLAEDVVTFRELDRSAREVAAWLAARPEADRPVLLLFEPGIAFWRAFLGCLYAGVVAIPAPLPARSAEHGACRRDTSRCRQQPGTDHDEASRPACRRHRRTRPRAPDPMRGHRRFTDRRRGRGRVDAPAHHRRHRGLPAVHIRLDRRPQGRRRHPRQRDGQRGHDLRSRFQ